VHRLEASGYVLAQRASGDDEVRSAVVGGAVPWNRFVWRDAHLCPIFPCQPGAALRDLCKTFRLAGERLQGSGSSLRRRGVRAREALAEACAETTSTPWCAAANSAAPSMRGTSRCLRKRSSRSARPIARASNRHVHVTGQARHATGDHRDAADDHAGDGQRGDRTRHRLDRFPQRWLQRDIRGRHARRSRSFRHAARATATSRVRMASVACKVPANRAWRSKAASSAAVGPSGPSWARSACSRRSAARHPITRRRRSAADVLTRRVYHRRPEAAGHAAAATRGHSRGGRLGPRRLSALQRPSSPAHRAGRGRPRGEATG
jgi:hypothetical protein